VVAVQGGSVGDSLHVEVPRYDGSLGQLTEVDVAVAVAINGLTLQISNVENARVSGTAFMDRLSLLGAGSEWQRRGLQPQPASTSQSIPRRPTAS
jgi:hypothetical protein